MIKFPSKIMLACNGKKNAIYILPYTKARSTEIPSGRTATKKAFSTFTDWEIDQALSFSLPSNRTNLKKIGRLNEIVYESDKWSGKKNLYVHEFETPVDLYADRSDPYKAVVYGAKSRTGKKLVSKRGLIA